MPFTRSAWKFQLEMMSDGFVSSDTLSSDGLTDDAAMIGGRPPLVTSSDSDSTVSRVSSIYGTMSEAESQDERNMTGECPGNHMDVFHESPSFLVEHRISAFCRQVREVRRGTEVPGPRDLPQQPWWDPSVMNIDNFLVIDTGDTQMAIMVTLALGLDDEGAYLIGSHHDVVSFEDFIPTPPLPQELRILFSKVPMSDAILARRIELRGMEWNHVVRQPDIYCVRALMPANMEEGVLQYLLQE